jgi:hypothetical protein
MTRLPPITSDPDIEHGGSGIAALEEGNLELGKHFCQHDHDLVYKKAQVLTWAGMSLFCHWIRRAKLRPP